MKYRPKQIFPACWRTRAAANGGGMGTGDQSQHGKARCASVSGRICRHIEEEGFAELPIGIEQATRAGLLPVRHRDPFDRLLVAQAQVEGLAIVSNDELLDGHGIRRIWRNQGRGKIAREGGSLEKVRSRGRGPHST
jgi:hypothetical protein